MNAPAAPRPAASPEANSVELERFQLYSRIEIAALLRTLAARRVPVTVYFGDGGEFIVSTLLAVNPDFEELVFDLGAHEETNIRLERAQRLVFVAFLDQVKLQFVAQRAERTQYEHLPALRARLPDSVMRLQRRDYYRVEPPISRPLLCSIPSPVQPGERCEYRVADLSVGGIAMMVTPGSMPLPVDALLEECRIELPEVGRITFSLRVRDVQPVTLQAGRGALRCGGQFLAPSGQMVTLLQRYILKIERDRLARL